MLNKSGRSVKAKVYNENDSVKLFTYQELVIAKGAMASLKAKGENFINVYLDDASFKPQVGKSYVFNGTNFGKKT